MTREEANEILGYVAQEIISPLAFDKRLGGNIWEELTSEKFSKLCKFVNNFVSD